MNQNPTAAWLRHVDRAIAEGTLVRLRLQAADAATEVRPVQLASGTVLSFTEHQAKRDLVQNLSPDAARADLALRVTTCTSAWLETTGTAWQLVQAAGTRTRLVRHATAPSAPAPAAHDRARRQRLGPAARTWLRALELIDESGRPRQLHARKLRQMERYADLLAHLAATCGWKPGQTLAAADMGCGKGYLPFTAWHLLRELGFDPHVTGVDEQPGVIDAATRAAEQAGATGLTFQAGRIDTCTLPPLDALIALHACDTATDHALARGVALGARLLVVAPCCHKELRRGLGNPEPLAPVLAYGLFRERFAEGLADGLRALALQTAGYRVTVAEFVEAEHTPRNVLIGGVAGLPAPARDEARQQYEALKAWSGLGPLATDALLNPDAAQ